MIGDDFDVRNGGEESVKNYFQISRQEAWVNGIYWGENEWRKNTLEDLGRLCLQSVNEWLLGIGRSVSFHSIPLSSSN